MDLVFAEESPNWRPNGESGLGGRVRVSVEVRSEAASDTNSRLLAAIRNLIEFQIAPLLLNELLSEFSSHFG